MTTHCLACSLWEDEDGGGRFTARRPRSRAFHGDGASWSVSFEEACSHVFQGRLARRLRGRESAGEAIRNRWRSECRST